MTKPVRLALVLLGLAVLAFAGWSAWLGLQVRGHLQDAADQVTDLREAVASGRTPRVEEALAALREDLDAADDRTHGPTWSVLGVLPFVGDDAQAVRTVTEVGSDLAHEGLGPLVAAGALETDRFAPQDGRIDLDAVAQLAGPLESSAQVFADGRDRLEAVDADGLVGPLADEWSEAVDDVEDAASGLDAARIAARVLPGMLGADGTRHQLVVFQTNAEPRASGGMPGSVARLDVRDGRMSLGTQRAAGSFGEAKKPVLPITEAELARFGPQLGTDVRDAAFTPHFPREAELIAARWKQTYHQEVDGVVAVDPVALGYLLEATGPVRVGTVELTSANLAEELLHGAYLRYPDSNDAQDRWFEVVSATVFERISSGSVNGEKLVSALSRGAREGRLHVHSLHPDEQAELAGTRVAGEIPSDVDEAPEAGVFINDATGSKMGWYLDYDVTVTASCASGKRRGVVASMELRSTLKKGEELPESVTGPGTMGTPRGQHLVVVELFGPQGGTLAGLQYNGESQPGAEYSTYLGHRTTSVAVLLTPGSRHTITWTMNTPSDAPVKVRVGAGVQAEDESVVAPACR